MLSQVPGVAGDPRRTSVAGLARLPGVQAVDLRGSCGKELPSTMDLTGPERVLRILSVQVAVHSVRHGAKSQSASIGSALILPP